MSTRGKHAFYIIEANINHLVNTEYSSLKLSKLRDKKKEKMRVSNSNILFLLEYKLIVQDRSRYRYQASRQASQNRKYSYYLWFSVCVCLKCEHYEGTL